jgi:hypothetical protein
MGSLTLPMDESLRGLKLLRQVAHRVGRVWHDQRFIWLRVTSILRSDEVGASSEQGTREGGWKRVDPRGEGFLVAIAPMLGVAKEESISYFPNPCR